MTVHYKTTEIFSEIKYDSYSLSILNSLHTAVSLVKTQGSVLTTSRIAPHLSQRQIINLN